MLSFTFQTVLFANIDSILGTRKYLHQNFIYLQYFCAISLSQSIFGKKTN